MYVLLLIFYLLIFSFCSTVCAVLTLPWLVMVAIVPLLENQSFFPN